MKMKSNVVLRPFAAALLLLSLNTMSSDSPSIASALSQSVAVIGLNAALQKRFVLPPGQNLAPGNVHRAQRCETGVGGKGQDVGVALSCLLCHKSKAKAAMANSPDDKSVLVAQFLGAGAAGDAVSHALRTRHGLSDALTVRNAAPLRTCTTIVGADESTELVETSGEVTVEEMALLRRKVDEMTKEGGKADCVCVMGSMPPGCEVDTYAELTERLAGRGTLVLIDSVVGLDPLLVALAKIRGEGDGSKKGGGAVLKLNAAELCKLAGVEKAGGEGDRVSAEELAASARGFAAAHAGAVGALDYLCVTDGKWPGHLVEVSADFRTWQLPAVDLSGEGTLYPIGAGDTVAAGTLAAWQYLHRRLANSDGFFGVISSEIGMKLSNRVVEWSKGASAEEEAGVRMATAFAFGLSCGSASCLQQENSVFDVDDAVKFFSTMNQMAVVERS